MIGAPETPGPKHWNQTLIPDRVTHRAYTKWANEDGCWISSYSTASHGYAQIGWREQGKNKMVLAHRASWEHVNGRVPPGMTLDHNESCVSKKCVNPSHLRIMSNANNGGKRGRKFPLGFCGRGHPDSYRRTYTFSSGKRYTVCDLCFKENQKKHRKKKMLEQKGLALADN